MNYYARRTLLDDKRDWQLLTSHLIEVASLASEFASHFNASDWAYLSGILHDAGKFSLKFQKRLTNSSIKVDHSTPGAQYIYELWNKDTKAHLLAAVIAGHHAGLMDFGLNKIDTRSLSKRLVKCIEDTQDYKESLEHFLPINKGKSKLTIPIQPGIHQGLQLSLFTRMLFSCLVDADSLNAELFVTPNKYHYRSNHSSIPVMLERYKEYMNSNFSNPITSINKARLNLHKECLEQARNGPGIYTLSLPTGSGKTLISLGFALHHAMEYGKRRIIFVIPYTSIIEQTVKVYRKVLGYGNVLEHHSNVQHYSDTNFENHEEQYKTLKKLEMAEENWDFPIIVTTNVQFFESLFSNKRSRCRKLHNIANSIIIIDEAQMMNGGLYKPSLYALEELHRNYQATILLSTATQPVIQELFEKPINIVEIKSHYAQIIEQSRTVELTSLGLTTLDDLAKRIVEHKQVLCITNTRRDARELYNKTVALIGSKHVYHLSARMCARHRRKKLLEIDRRLDKKLPVLLISTQLIECGVDIDFPIVYRELAGLDSIKQAAGRCNRDGRYTDSKVYVYNTQLSIRNKWLNLTSNITKRLLQKHAKSPLSKEALTEYFQELYFYQSLNALNPSDDLTDQHKILPKLKEQASICAFPFETVANCFQLIETTTKPVLIDWDTFSKKQLEVLESATNISKVIRKLQPYVVQLYEEEFNAFCKSGEIIEIRENIFKLLNPKQWYSNDIGIIPYSSIQQEKENDIG